jgi:hypothetical protein
MLQTDSHALASFFTRAVKLLVPEKAFSVEEFRKRLVRVVVDGMLPFSVVELEAFRSSYNLCKPGVAFPSAKTLKSDLMKCYREEEDRVNERLRNANSNVSTTLDCWTSPHNEAYLGVTGHYIDNDWTLKSLLLDRLCPPGW